MALEGKGDRGTHLSRTTYCITPGSGEVVFPDDETVWTYTFGHFNDPLPHILKVDELTSENKNGYK